MGGNADEGDPPPLTESAPPLSASYALPLDAGPDWCRPPVDNAAGALLGGASEVLAALIEEFGLILPAPTYPYGRGW